MELFLQITGGLTLLLCCADLTMVALLLHQKLEKNEMERRKDRLSLTSLEPQFPDKPMAPHDHEFVERLQASSDKALKNMRGKKFRSKKRN